MRHDVFRRRRILSTAAVASAAIVINAASNGASAQTSRNVQFDLRVAGTGAKEATVSHGGDFVLVDLFANVTGLDANPANDSLSIATGNLHSSTGGLRGDLKGIIPPFPFDALSASAGTPVDLDGDGDLDIGNNNVNDATGTYTARSGFLAPSEPGGQWIGRALFTVGDVTTDSTQVDFAERPVSTFQAFFDGVLRAYSPGQFTFSSSPLTVTGTPAPDPADLQFLDGMIDTHLTVKNNFRVTPGGSLTLTQGLDVRSSGSLEKGDGTLTVNVNDATSRNTEGGRLVANNLSVATTADGTFTQSGGVTNVGAINIGAGAGLTGTLAVAGGQLRGGATTVGAGGTGILRQTGGQSLLDSLDVNAGSSAELRGGSALILGNGRVGVGGSASFTQTNGDSTFGNLLQVGDGAGGAGTITVTGGTLSAGRLNVGNSSGVGSINHSGGTVTAGSMNIGSPLAPFPSGVSTYAISNTAQLNSTSIMIANNGLLTQSGGTVSIPGSFNSLTVRNAPGAVAQYAMSNGTLNTPVLRVSQTNAAPVPQTGHTGGFAQTGGTVNASQLVIDPSGTYEALGGSINISSQLTLRGTIDFGGSNAFLNFGTNSLGDFTQGQIANAGNATFTGQTGSLMNFASQAQYDSVGTVTTDGMVHINGQALAIASRQSVSGTGTITGDVTNAGTVSPGHSPGTLAIKGDFAQTGDGLLKIDLAGNGKDKFDTLDISGDATLGGDLNVALLDAFTPSAGDSFTILRADHLSGTFANAADSLDLAGLGKFDVNYSSDAVTLSDFVPAGVNAVPEPTSLALLATAAGALAFRRRRRRRVN